MFRKQPFSLFGILLLIVFKSFSQEPELLLPVGHVMPVSDVCFSPDGRLVVTNGEKEKNVKIWETQTGKLIRTIDAHADRITSVSFSPDGKYLLTTGHDRSARIWDVQSGILYHTINYYFNNWIVKGFFSNDGKKILLISDDAMEYHDVFTKKLLRPLLDTTSVADHGLFGKSRYRFYSYDMSRDGRLTITANSDSSIKIWDNNTGNIIHKIKNESLSFRVCSFNPPGNKFLASSLLETSIWETNGAKLQRIRKADKGLIIFSLFHPAGETILTGMIDTITMDGSLELWDIKTGAVLRSFTQPGLKAVMAATFNRDGRLLLTMSIDGKTRLWETQTGKLLRTVATPDPALKKVMLEIDTDEILQYTKAAFSPDSKFIIAASLSNMATIQETATGKKTAELEGISSMIRIPGYSPDGKLLATAGNKGIVDLIANPQGYVTMWDMASGNVLYELKGHKGIITDIKFSADNTRIATASEDSTVRIWERYSGKLLKVITGHEKAVYKCYFADSSRYVVTQTFNGQIRLWDTETGSLVTSLQHEKATANNYGVYTSTPSATRKYFKTVFYDDYKTIITESATGKTIFSFVPGKDSIPFFVIDPSDKYFVYSKSKEIVIEDILSG
ncbi:MAG TPA: WD40 repeat domain-containing protein, partial [Chitinophagaceae bacterium]